MTKMSDTEVPYLTLEEVASDGSTLSNPSADHRKLFVGEDGDIHLRDSAGGVTTPGGSGGITAQSATLGSAVTVNNGSYGPTILQINALADGTYIAMATCFVQAPGASTITIHIKAGATQVAEAGWTAGAANDRVQLSLLSEPFVVSGGAAPNLVMEAWGNGTSFVVKEVDSIIGTGNITNLVLLKIA